MRKVIFTLLLSLMLLISVNSSQAAAGLPTLEWVGTSTYDGTDPFVCNVWYDVENELLWLDHIFGATDWDSQNYRMYDLSAGLSVYLFDNWVFDLYDFNDWTLPFKEDYFTLPGNAFGDPNPEGIFWTCEFDEILEKAYAVDLNGQNGDLYNPGENFAGLAVNYTTLSQVPIPGALWLLGSGLLAFVTISRKRK